jgi:hypothetical protein
LRLDLFDQQFLLPGQFCAFHFQVVLLCFPLQQHLFLFTFQAFDVGGAFLQQLHDLFGLFLDRFDAFVFGLALLSDQDHLLLDLFLTPFPLEVALFDLFHLLAGRH